MVLVVLRDIRIASPCSADWDRMCGDDRVRFCPECQLNVYNFSAMTPAEVETVAPPARAASVPLVPAHRRHHADAELSRRFTGSHPSHFPRCRLCLLGFSRRKPSPRGRRSTKTRRAACSDQACPSPCNSRSRGHQRSRHTKSPGQSHQRVHRRRHNRSRQTPLASFASPALFTANTKSRSSIPASKPFK